MNDLTILHLSDLHITGETEQYSRLLRNLLDDIKSEVQYINDNSLIVVVTGDILHKADKRATKAAKAFFERLKSILGEKVVGIYIVPGNHDKARTEENKFLIPAYRSFMAETSARGADYSFGNVFYKAFWPFHLDSYNGDSGTGYLGLVSSIYNMFGMPDDMLSKKSFVTETFGVDLKQVNGKKYCFVLLNTAWACVDDYDDRNLVLGKFQLDEIKKQFHCLTDELKKGEELALTFVLGHHPISALHGKEEDSAFADMISFDELDADVYMCGHTHSRAAINWSNNRHSISTLVTGIGWPEHQGGNRVGDHTYSMYVFNLDANSADIYVRSTGDDGKFRPDLRIYTTDAEKESKKIVLPIHARDSQTYLTIGTGVDRSPKSYYISGDFMTYIQDYSLRVARFRGVIESCIELDKNLVYNDMGIDDEDMEEEQEQEDIDSVYSVDESLYNYLFIQKDYEHTIPDDIHTFFCEHKNMLFDLFLGFLSKICQKLLQILIGDKKENTIVRFHFRYLADRNTYQYCRLCTSFSSDEEMGDNDVSIMKYGELLSASYDADHSLIYQVNSYLCKNKLKDKWKNFITIIPNIQQNHYIRRTSGGTKLRRPYLTFGVTINDEEYNWLLYCMDFFSFKNILEEIIEQYALIFGIDIGEFCEWAKRNIESKEALG